MPSFPVMRLQQSREPQVLPNPAARRALLLGSAIGLGRTPTLSSDGEERHVPLAFLLIAALFVMALAAVI